MPASKIKTDLHFKDSEYVVFLINIKGTQHAFLLIESNLQMIRCDYGANASLLHVAAQTISSLHRRFASYFFTQVEISTIPGSVSMTPVIKEDFVELAEKNQLQYQHWVIDSTQQVKLLGSIMNDIARPSVYGTSGDKAILGSGETNCLTWSIEKLKEIDLTVKEHWSIYVLVAKPSTVDKPSLCALM